MLGVDEGKWQQFCFPIRAFMLRITVRVPLGGRHRHGAHNSPRLGGEKGDPLMPLLFSVGSTTHLLEAVGAQLRKGEHFLAFLENIHMVTRPERVSAAHACQAGEDFPYATFWIRLLNRTTPEHVSGGVRRSQQSI